MLFSSGGGDVVRVVWVVIVVFLAVSDASRGAVNYVSGSWWCWWYLVVLLKVSGVAVGGSIEGISTVVRGEWWEMMLLGWSLDQVINNNKLLVGLRGGLSRNSTVVGDE